MAKEEKPLEYQRRIRDTKGVSQRLDLGYLRRPALLLLLRRRATWLLVAAAAIAAVPLISGIGGSRRLVQSGPLSDAHAILEKKCESCHTQSFGGVADKACQSCHDGAPHPAKSIDTAHPTAQVRCAECHREHRGKVRLVEVADAFCVRCHADLKSHATGVKLAGAKITGFASDAHPEFSRPEDHRPLRLNHAIHMPAQPRTIRGMKLPMKCADCHVPGTPVTFDAHCKSCHARELEFDVYHVGVPPAPHTKDKQRIHEWIVQQYQVLAKTPITRRPLGNDLSPMPNPAAWLDRVVRDSEAYLFDRKCVYCHTGTGPMVGPQLERSEFDHRAHRAVTCDSCHTAARTSTRTEDVLLPAMKSCTPCHGSSESRLDRCSTCHQYHNRQLERDHSKPLRDLTGYGRPPGRPFGRDDAEPVVTGERSSPRESEARRLPLHASAQAWRPALPDLQVGA